VLAYKTYNRKNHEAQISINQMLTNEIKKINKKIQIKK
jgi:hypothetical protein